MRTNGDKTRAAGLLSISRRNLIRKVKAYNLVESSGSIESTS
ncbi:MAG: helix-turn-helix domain-containing protein [Myxococcota bacterium]